MAEKGVKEPSETKKVETEEVEGLLVLTINVGDFELLAEKEDKEASEGTQSHKSRFAVLVDGHEGAQEGTLLQHPIFRKLVGGNASLDEQGSQFQIDPEMLKTMKDGGILDYVDPVSKEPRGHEFGGKWIAAMQRVDISRRVSESRERTDLWVLVQERADSITAPVASMVTRLIREGVVALLALLAVVSILWVVVLWVMRLPDSFISAVRSRGGGGTEMTGTANDATLDAER